MAKRRIPEGGPAVFSECRRYRYRLERDLADGGIFDRCLPGKIVCFIMLNPSTADEQLNDPTVRRCIGYAMDWGAARLIVGNAFAIRGTDPAIISATEDPVGPDNDAHLLRMAREAINSGGIIVVAWGNHGLHRCRSKAIVGLMTSHKTPLFALDWTSSGMPCHPLYLSAKLRPKLYCGNQEWPGGRANESLKIGR